MRKETKLKCLLGKKTAKIKLRPYVSRSKFPNFDAANTVYFCTINTLMNESVNNYIRTCALAMSAGKTCSPSEDISAQSDLILSC